MKFVPSFVQDFHNIIMLALELEEHYHVIIFKIHYLKLREGLAKNVRTTYNKT